MQLLKAAGQGHAAVPDSPAALLPAELLCASLLLPWGLVFSPCVHGVSVAQVLLAQQLQLQGVLLLLTIAAASAAASRKQLCSAAVLLLVLLLLEGVLHRGVLLPVAKSLKSSTVSSRIRSVDRINSLWLSPSHTTYKSSNVLHAGDGLVECRVVNMHGCEHSSGGLQESILSSTYLARLLCSCSKASLWYC